MILPHFSLSRWRERAELAKVPRATLARGKPVQGGVRVALRVALTVATLPAQAQPTNRAEMIDRLLGALQAAPDEQQASALEGAITGAWLEGGSPAVRLLLARGLRELADTPQDALDDLDAALDLDPALIEGWHSRALARARLGDADGAARDIAQTIRLEPRHFAAFADLSRIAEQREDWRGAYEAQQKVLELDPKTPGGEARLKDLHRRAFGDPT